MKEKLFLSILEFQCPRTVKKERRRSRGISPWFWSYVRMHIPQINWAGWANLIIFSLPNQNGYFSLEVWMKGFPFFDFAVLTRPNTSTLKEELFLFCFLNDEFKGFHRE